MKKIVKSILSPFLGKRQLQGFFRVLFLLGLKGMNIGGGSTYSESGEDWVLRHLAGRGQDKFILFDVGANQGQYALLAEKALSATGRPFEIYSFEPSPVTFAMLQKAAAGKQGIKPFNCGLGNEQKQLPLYTTGTGSGLASLYNRDVFEREHMVSHTEQVSVLTLDGFAVAHSIDRIDLLKIDVEGHELAVLQGARNLLDQGKVQTIQFEFGGTAVDARIYLKDFFEVLFKNYRMYRILQNGLHELPAYSEWDEIFVTTNYLAIKRNGHA